MTEIDIQNDVIKTYMAYGPYDSFCSTVSYLYYSDVKELADKVNWIADKPVGYTVNWTHSTLSSIEVLENGKEWIKEYDISEPSYTIMNLTPGSIYTYTVYDENGVVITSGEFKAVGQLRMVYIKDTWNCRDLGGWIGLNNKQVKYGKIFRGASLSGKYLGGDLTDHINYDFHSQSYIDQLGIKAELDLRGDKDQPGKWGNDKTPHSSSFKVTKLIGVDYIRIMSDFGLINPQTDSSLVKCVSWIINELKLGKPVIFHCRCGFHRTGAVAYLIEGLLGVKPGDIARDYEINSFSSFNSIKRYASYPTYVFFKDEFGYVNGNNFQERCYYYLNQYFKDVHVNADDLDWFICEMLGLDSYEHPKDALNYD